MTKIPVTRGKTSRARRWMVFLIGLGCVVRGYAYGFHQGAGGPNPRGGALQTFEIPEQAIGVIWILVGALCLWSALISRWLYAISAAGGLWVIWGLGYAWAWVAGTGLGNDWISASTYLFTGLAIWTVTRQPDVPEAPAGSPLHEEKD